MFKYFISLFFIFSTGISKIIGSFDNDTFNKNLSKTTRSSQNQNDCISMQQRDTSVLIDQPVMNWNMLRKEIVGLTNKSSTSCYINSALQCFASTPPLVKWLSDHIDKLKTCKNQISM